MIVVDTCLFVSLLARDDEHHYRTARRILEGEQQVFVPRKVLWEVWYVLRTERFGWNRDRRVQALLFIANLENVVLEDADQTRAILDEVVHHNIDLGDAFIAASAKAQGGMAIVTLDTSYVKRGQRAGHQVVLAADYLAQDGDDPE